MNLFELKDFKVTFSPQALALKPFKALWNRDKSKDKERAVNELAYIYFFCDYQSDYADIVDEKSRDEQVRGMVDLPKDWKIDKKVREAMELYDKLQDSVPLQSLRAARNGIHKLNKYLNDVDLTETDKNGRLIHSPKTITDTVEKIGKNLESLEKITREVKKAIEASQDNQGSLEPAIFEDGMPD